NDDTLAVTHTNADGAFDITTTFSVADSYAIFLDVEHQNKMHDWIKLHVKGDTNQVSDYYMELGKLRVIHDRFDTGTYYELNETVEHTDFDFSFLQSMIDEYPQLCIRFVQTIHPEETLKTANKRKRHFLKELKAAGVNMDQVL